MADKNKKMAAALAAVSMYLQEEEEAACQQAAAAVEVVQSCGNEFSQWSMSGRQEMMAMRRLMQLRVFDRIR